MNASEFLRALYGPCVYIEGGVVEYVPENYAAQARIVSDGEEVWVDVSEGDHMPEGSDAIRLLYDPQPRKASPVSELQSIQKEGGEARRRKIIRSNNPYPPETKGHNAWNLGWDMEDNLQRGQFHGARGDI